MKTLALTTMLLASPTVGATEPVDPPGIEKVQAENTGLEKTAVTPGETPATAKPAARPRVQLALLLDTSGSMSGLIDQARAELWKIVNEFALVRQGGQLPDVQVALFEYGKSTIPAEEGFLRMIVPLTDDLDRISEELFQLTTNGGSEHCGQVIQAAIERLGWTDDREALKTIFIAGNEPFDQGPVDPVKACQAAIARGVTVNTIYCGSEAEGINTHWKQGSVLADGGFFAINHNQKVAHVPAPQDEEIARLGIELNKTYIPYGALGKKLAIRQSTQDGEANQVGLGSGVQRAACKASALYKNSSWDLVDAINEKKVDLAKLDRKELPEELRKLDEKALQAVIDGKLAERKKLQETIKTLNAERVKHVTAERAKLASQPGVSTLDSAIIDCVRKQAALKGFEVVPATGLDKSAKEESNENEKSAASSSSASISCRNPAEKSSPEKAGKSETPEKVAEKPAETPRKVEKTEKSGAKSEKKPSGSSDAAKKNPGC